ncbi:bifunctional 3,4-dihydroxy-2-butanone-4-phosphate synthase/GTP cyclohydrolase II [Allochromatium vinosum]|uniref:3,4-dihydroxy-2-butanone 4-phosphate synthase n=1 Tax=Allochromatium vinosum (strain ATCC 17899 / DSM 180 / NBRC 103801 / NCIMB 10441 / D) TaxID=572477 RepID=D3RU39_ALLVD|nr:bifunctional 3,4-dihydroxy-2-butanone-4-phosphate synthase/GTP cyclohydrolase II [Allochromatium vinosum]ADC62698.1 3,4-dihydroxy-2-butanone 4-phosphate synthase [Allochromatium vinosum DSM 180]MBK1656104.1 bifunctional 3,4-dihydroxy-2-butanone-4-phosphate synthase/GTP cyclohydrolase II [Allochromatium vinosum]
MSSTGLNTTEEIIDDLRAGKMVIIMDDEDRENEGDLLMAADYVTPEAVNFMAKYGRGLICLTLTKERCEQLRLPLMVSDNQAVHSTAFTVSIEAARGVTTGISAADRATTIRAAVAPDAGPRDLVQPGHIFPLMAQPGGVLVRAGHTEAGCDLVRLAGLTPAAAIVEILNEDGTMARRPDLEVFAQTHGIKIGTIADLIHYRMRNETAVIRECECELPTAHGTFDLIAYRDTIDGEIHLALTLGEISPERPTLVRVHLQNTLCDLFDTTHNACGWPLRDVMRQVAEAGEGVIVVLRNRDHSADLLSRLKDFQFHGSDDPVPVRQDRGELRTYGIGAQILADLGVRKMRVMSAPKAMHAISGFDLEVVEYTGGRSAS